VSPPRFSFLGHSWATEPPTKTRCCTPAAKRVRAAGDGAPCSEQGHPWPSHTSSRVRHSPLIRYISRSITCAGSNNLEPAGYAPPHQWSPRDPINRVCQLASKILAKSRYALIVPTNCRLGFSGRCTMKADPHHARLAASSRAETVSQSSSSAVPDSISSMRLLISALHPADAPTSSGSRL